MRSVFCNVSEVILDLNFCLLTLDFSVYTTVYTIHMPLLWSHLHTTI